ncbi:ATP-binding protein [Mycobacterium vulneris]|nr:ATP-binding protein [Mycolicibacterium vulneris]
MSREVSAGRLARGSKLGKIAAKHAVSRAGVRVSMLGRSEEAKRILSERKTIEAADDLVTVLGAMKGAAMKLGQMLSVLDLDLVPESHREQFRVKLARLRDQAPRVRFGAMRKVLENDLGPMAGVFADFDESPIAAASIGQVYRARLRDGRQVAVKVQYPDVDQAVRSDMRNLAVAVKLWRSAWPALDAHMLEEISCNLENELDYVREARTQHLVAQQYRGHPFVTVPDSVAEYCSPHVLVTEFLEGVGFDHMQRMPAADRDCIGEVIHRFYIGSLFLHNEFCGDPHPGNVLLADDGRVGFIDFGLYKHMDPGNVAFEADCLRTAAEGRADDLYRLLVGRGWVDPTSKVTPEECLEYTRTANEWHMVDEQLTVTPELASGALLVALDPRSDHFAEMKRQKLPPDHLISRRADVLTFGTLGQLGATNNWYRIAREWFYGDPPATEIGREIARWRAAG